MNLDPNGDNSIWGNKPDDLLVKFTGQLFGVTAATLLAALFFYFAWRDAARTAVQAGGLLRGLAGNAGRRLAALTATRVALAIFATVSIVVFEVFWLCCVFAVGNLVSLQAGQRDQRILQFDLLDPLATSGVLVWDPVSTIYVLLAVLALLISRWYYRREYGTGFLGFVVAAPGVFLGGLAALVVVFRLVLLGLALLFDGPTDLDEFFWLMVKVAAAGASYTAMCLLAPRAAVVAGNIWLGDEHNGGRSPLDTGPAVSADARAYFKAFYAHARKHRTKDIKRINWRTRGWLVSHTTSDEYRPHDEYLYVTTSGRPVYVGHHGGVERVDRHLHKFPVDWTRPPSQNPVS